MRTPDSIPQRIALFIHPEFLKSKKAKVEEIYTYLLSQKLERVTQASAENQDFRQEIREGRFDAVIALGGDGTMLRAGHLSAECGAPILGINLGHFGFLMELKHREWRTYLPRFLSGDFFLEDRRMLQVEHWRGRRRLGTWFALNETVISRGRYVRPIQLSARVDVFQMATFVADGLIVATATGSTAYALAAGGPILPPELDNIVIMAVAPHLSMDRAIVLPGSSRVNIAIQTSHEAVMSIDGQNPIQILNGDFIRTLSCDCMASFVRFQDAGYFYRKLNAFMEQNPLNHHEL